MKKKNTIDKFVLEVKEHIDELLLPLGICIYCENGFIMTKKINSINSYRICLGLDNILHSSVWYDLTQLAFDILKCSTFISISANNEFYAMNNRKIMPNPYYGCRSWHEVLIKKDLM